MNDNIVFFDGVCKFCNATVNFLLKHNTKNNLFFSPIQSSFAQKILSDYKIDITNITTIIFLKNNQIYTKSSAALTICKELEMPWKEFYYLIFIPKIIRNFFYNIIAKNRYKWFGKLKSCRIFTADEKSRILE